MSQPRLFLLFVLKSLSSVFCTQHNGKTILHICDWTRKNRQFIPRLHFVRASAGNYHKLLVTVVSLLKLTLKEKKHIFTARTSLNGDIQIGITFLLSNTHLHPDFFLPIFMARRRMGFKSPRTRTSCFAGYLVNLHQILRLFSVKRDNRSRLKIMIGREKTSKLLWLVRHCS